MVAHSEILLTKCAQFREQGEFIDVRLKVGEDVFPAHRIVLAANSDYFHAMFTHGMTESNQEVIELKDENISAAALKIVMDSIYSGELHVDDENVFEVLLAADHLQVTGVVEQCCDYLQTEFLQLRFDVQMYCRICTIADRHCLTHLQEATQRKMAAMYREICESEEFLSHIGADQLSNLLSRDDLSAPSETFVFKSVMQWIRYKKEERMAVAAKVIRAVRLGLVDIKDVIEHLDTEEMQRIQEVHMLVYETLKHNCMPSHCSKFAAEKTKLRSTSPLLVAILPQAQMQYLDIQSKTWKPLPSMAQLTNATKCYCAELAGNHLYVAANRGKNLYRYNIVSDTWETLPHFSGATNQINCLCCFEEHVYVLGLSMAPQRYSVSTNQWQSLATMSVFCNPRSKIYCCNKAAVVFKSCVYVLYGQGVNIASRGDYWTPSLSVLYCFDPKGNVWEQKASTTDYHCESSLFVVNNRLYVAGGKSSIDWTGAPSGETASVEVYDDQNNTWSVVEQKHIPSNNLGAVEIEGRVYFIINSFPIDSGIRISPEEVYPIPLSEWDNLGKVNASAILCHIPVKM